MMPPTDLLNLGAQARTQLREIAEDLLLAWFAGITLFEWLVGKCQYLDINPDDSWGDVIVAILRWLAIDSIVVLPLLAVVPSLELGVPPNGSGWLQFASLVVYIPIIAASSFVLEKFFAPASKAWFISVGAIHVLSTLVLFTLPFFLTYRQAEISALAIRRIAKMEPLRCEILSHQTPAKANARQASILFAHLSDLHIVARDKDKTQEGSTPGNEVLPSLLSIVEAHNPRYLMITGDITDSGAFDEWEIAKANLGKIAGKTRIILCPGNHDFSLAFETKMLEHPDDWEASTHARLPRFVQLQASLYGGMTTAAGKTVSRIVQSAPPRPDPEMRKDAEQMLHACVKRCQEFTDQPAKMFTPCMRRCESDLGPSLEPIRKQVEWAKYWMAVSEDLFPLVELDQADQVAVISMASSIKAGVSIGTNAIGRMDDAQLGRLRTILRNLPTDVRTIIFLYHHPITAIENEVDVPLTKHDIASIQDTIRWADAFLRHDSEQAQTIGDLIAEELARRPATNAVFLFGHRHRMSLGTWRNIVFEEAPNAANAAAGVYFDQPGETSPIWCSLNAEPSSPVGTSLRVVTDFQSRQR
jgi:3',5'-cyclic AMP phosphodiesterase CpdA